MAFKIAHTIVLLLRCLMLQPKLKNTTSFSQLHAQITLDFERNHFYHLSRDGKLVLHYIHSLHSQPASHSGDKPNKCLGKCAPSSAIASHRLHLTV